MQNKLIIAEKPSVARKITQFLSKGKYKRIRFSKKVYYYSFELNGSRYFVVPALGHLYTISDQRRSLVFPTFDYKWVPSYIEDRIFIKKKYIELFENFSKKANDIIVATDFDIEGELIGFNIVRFALNRNNAKRMIFSAITPKDILKSFHEIKESIFKNFALAGETRHIIDWIYGINLSRALSYAIGKYKKGVVLSIGRVQGSTLKLIFEKEMEIQNFVSTYYYVPYINIQIGKEKIKLKHIKERFSSEKEARKTLEKIKNLVKVSKIEKTKKIIDPPYPYNLTDLQEDAYKLYKILPKQTLDIAQRLYEQGYISYPRTSSQQLPPTINFREIIKNLSMFLSYNQFCAELLRFDRLIPNNGPKGDVHPAIHPTGIIPKNLSRREWLIYDLICRRFIATFYYPAEIEKYKVFFGEFFFEYEKIIKKGWMKVYWILFKDNFKNYEIKVGDLFKVVRKGVSKRKTKGPERYNPASLIKKMESLNLGTKATRAEIVQILYKRKYIDGRKIKITELGKKIIELFEKYIPEILSIDLTRKIENKLLEIEKGKLWVRDKVIEETKEVVKNVCEEIKKNSDQIGKELYEIYKSLK